MRKPLYAGLVGRRIIQMRGRELMHGAVFGRCTDSKMWPVQPLCGRLSGYVHCGEPTVIPRAFDPDADVVFGLAVCPRCVRAVRRERSQP